MKLRSLSPSVAGLVLASGALSGVGAQSPCCQLTGAAIADRYRVAAIAERRFSHYELWSALEPYLDRGGPRTTEIGRSLHGREIRAVTFGSGPTRVLLWSQMHGDESTATMSLVDIIHFFAEGRDDPLRTLIEERLSVIMIPMLNPDGAERFQRRNAAGVDINRDARRLATPEARALKAVRDSLAPAFGFNLHDQGARTTAGEEGQQVAIALLAPAADTSRAYGPVRDRARQLAALLAAGLERLKPGRVAKYDDTFNPRAFGDLIQRWGTSTVLIESGALPDDPQKQELRRVNVMLLLTALEAIASERYREADPDVYENLPFNRRVASDILLTGGRVVIANGESLPLDVALAYEDPVARRGLRLGEVGDLEDAAAMDTVDVSGLYLHITTPSTLDPSDWWLIGGEPVAVVVRKGAEADAEVVMRFP
ncbi:MAG: M14 family zinc carboxypeptidase [Gemmatimonadales bacterium]|jgi:hypothetical protein